MRKRKMSEVHKRSLEAGIQVIGGIQEEEWVSIEKETYLDLKALTIDPPIEFRNLSYHAITKEREGYAITHIIDIKEISDGEQEEEAYIAKTQKQITVKTIEQAQWMMRELKSYLMQSGIPIAKGMLPPWN